MAAAAPEAQAPLPRAPTPPPAPPAPPASVSVPLLALRKQEGGTVTIRGRAFKAAALYALLARGHFDQVPDITPELVAEIQAKAGSVASGAPPISVPDEVYVASRTAGQDDDDDDRGGKKERAR